MKNSLNFAGPIQPLSRQLDPSERVLDERSNDAKLFSFSNGRRIEPLKELHDRFR